MSDERKLQGFVFGLGETPEPNPEIIAAAMVDFGPGLDETAEQLCQQAREAKEEWVSYNNGPCDIPNTLTAVYPNGAFQLPLQMLSDHTGMRPPEAIDFLLFTARKMNDDQPPMAVLLSLEAFHQEVSDDTDQWLSEYRPGSMEDRFKAGDSRVSECLIISVATPERVWGRSLPYHYGDGGVIWDKPSPVYDPGGDWLNMPPGGNVEQVLQKAFAPPGGGDDEPE